MAAPTARRRRRRLRRAAADRPGRAPRRRRSASPGLPRRRRSGGPGAARLLRRSATCCSTCPAATTTCARCASSASSSGSRTGRSCRPGSRVVDIRVEPSFRRRVQRTIAVLEDETGTIDATWFGRRFIERRLHPGARSSSGQGQTVRPEADARQPGVPGGRRGGAEVLHAGRIVPVYRLTAGLTAARLRIGDPRGARPRRPRLPGVPARGPARGEGLTGIAPALEEAHYPAPSRAGTPPSAGWRSTSCWRSRWHGRAATATCPRRGTDHRPRRRGGSRDPHSPPRPSPPGRGGTLS